MATAAAESVKTLNQLCRELNLDQSTADAANRLWERCSSTLCVDDEEETMAWIASVLYITACRLLPSMKAASPSGISIQSLLVEADLTAIAFFKHLDTFSQRASLQTSEDESADERKIISRHARSRLNDLYSTLTIRRMFDRLFERIYRHQPLQQARKRVTEDRLKIYDIGLTMLLLGKHYIPDSTANFNNAFQLLASVLLFCYRNTAVHGLSELLLRKFDTDSDMLQFLCDNVFTSSLDEDATLKLALHCSNFFNTHFSRFLLETEGLGLSVQAKNHFAMQSGPTSKRTDPLSHTCKKLEQCYETFILFEGIIDERDPFKHMTESTHRVPELTPIGRYNARRYQVTATYDTMSPARQMVNSIGALRAIIDGREEPHISKVSEFSPALDRLLRKVADDTCKESLGKYLADIGEEFRQMLVRNAPEEDQQTIVKRIDLSIQLFYAILLNIITRQEEAKLLQSRDLLLTTMAIGAELFLFTLNRASVAFPWVLRCLNSDGCSFSVMTEFVVRKVPNLLKVHVRHIERCRLICIQRLVWEPTSTMWNLDIADVLDSLEVASTQRTPMSRPSVLFRQIQTHALELLEKIREDLRLDESCITLASRCCLFLLRNHGKDLLCGSHFDAFLMSCVYMACRTKMPSKQITFKHLLASYQRTAQGDPKVLCDLTVGNRKMSTIVDYYSQLFLPRVQATVLLDIVKRGEDSALSQLQYYALEAYQQHPPRKLPSFPNLTIHSLQAKRKRAGSDLGAMKFTFRTVRRDTTKQKINDVVQRPEEFAKQLERAHSSTQSRYRLAPETRVLSHVLHVESGIESHLDSTTSMDESSDREEIGD